MHNYISPLKCVIQAKGRYNFCAGQQPTYGHHSTMLYNDSGCLPQQKGPRGEQAASETGMKDYII